MVGLFEIADNESAVGAAQLAVRQRRDGADARPLDDVLRVRLAAEQDDATERGQSKQGASEPLARSPRARPQERALRRGQGMSKRHGEPKTGVRLINATLLYIMIRVQSFLNTCGCGPRIDAVAKDQHRRLTWAAGALISIHQPTAARSRLRRPRNDPKTCSWG